MESLKNKNIIVVIALLMGSATWGMIGAIPVESNGQAVNTGLLSNELTNGSQTVKPSADLEPGKTDQGEVENVQEILQGSGTSNKEDSEISDNDVAASTMESSAMWPPNLIPAEAIQQYLNQYGAAYSPYPTYPSPIGYGPPPPPPAYPTPYVVQTGYEGFLMPATAVEEISAFKTGNENPTKDTGLNELSSIKYLSHLVTTLMMSSLFKIVATVVSVVGMIFFSGAISTAICSFTPICDISYKAAAYLRRRDNTERMGRMIAENMTPERLRRATEFVNNAVRKYRELERVLNNEK